MVFKTQGLPTRLPTEFQIRQLNFRRIRYTVANQKEQKVERIKFLIIFHSVLMRIDEFISS